MKHLTASGLAQTGTNETTCHAYVTPRRLILTARHVAKATLAKSETLKGPRTDAPAQALAGFLKRTGLCESDLTQHTTPKGSFWMASVTIPSLSAEDLFPNIVRDILQDFRWGQTMRWGHTDFSWVRPLHSITAFLHGQFLSLSVPLRASRGTTDSEKLDNKTAHKTHGEFSADHRAFLENTGAISGHRLWGANSQNSDNKGAANSQAAQGQSTEQSQNGAQTNLIRHSSNNNTASFFPKNWTDFGEGLAGRGVILDPDHRRAAILATLGHFCAQFGAVPFPEDLSPQGLIDELVGLAEWPYFIAVPLSEAHQKLPGFVTHTVLRHHMKCFVLKKLDQNNSDEKNVSVNKHGPETSAFESLPEKTTTQDSVAPFFLFMADRPPPQVMNGSVLDSQIILKALASEAEAKSEKNKSSGPEEERGSLKNFDPGILHYFGSTSEKRKDADTCDVMLRGIECVAKARLEDARFFMEEDQKTPIADRLDALKQRQFFKGLGSLSDKTHRLTLAAQELQKPSEHPENKPNLAENNLSPLSQAAQLCKADLSTHMVSEFPELQGRMGRYYGTKEGLSAPLARALEEHYWPKGSGDYNLADANISFLGAQLALLDRLDSTAGFFLLGQRPSGSKDPFALRRMGQGVMRLMWEISRLLMQEKHNGSGQTNSDITHLSLAVAQTFWHQLMQEPAFDLPGILKNILAAYRAQNSVCDALGAETQILKTALESAEKTLHDLNMLFKSRGLFLFGQAAPKLQKLAKFAWGSAHFSSVGRTMAYTFFLHAILGLRPMHEGMVTGLEDQKATTTTPALISWSELQQVEKILGRLAGFIKTLSADLESAAVGAESKNFSWNPGSDACPAEQAVWQKAQHFCALSFDADFFLFFNGLKTVCAHLQAFFDAALVVPKDPSLKKLRYQLFLAIEKQAQKMGCWSYLE